VTNIVSLVEYRARRRHAERNGQSALRRLIRAQSTVAEASRKFSDAVLGLNALAECLGRTKPGLQDHSGQEVRLGLERIDQCKRDCEAIVRLIERAGAVIPCHATALSCAVPPRR
jgi:hypothetical protein